MLIYCILFLYTYKVDRVVAQVHGHCSIPRLRGNWQCWWQHEAPIFSSRQVWRDAQGFLPPADAKNMLFSAGGKEIPWANLGQHLQNAIFTFWKLWSIPISERIWMTFRPSPAAFRWSQGVQQKFIVVFPRTTWLCVSRNWDASSMVTHWKSRHRVFFDSAAWDQCAVFFGLDESFMSWHCYTTLSMLGQRPHSSFLFEAVDQISSQSSPKASLELESHLRIERYLARTHRVIIIGLVYISSLASLSPHRRCKGDLSELFHVVSSPKRKHQHATGSVPILSWHW